MKKIFALIIILMLSACQQAANVPKKLAVDTVSAKNGEITVFSDVSGSLAPVRVSPVLSKVSGKVSSVSVKQGDTVREGSTVLQLETTEAKAAIKQAEAAVQTAKSRVQTAKANVAAARDTLSATKNTVPEQKTQASIAVNTAIENVDVARINVAQAEVALENAESNALYAKKDLEREQLLYDSGTTSLESLENTRQKRDDSLFQLEKAKNALTAAKTQLEIALNGYDTAISQRNLISGANSDLQITKAQGAYESALAEQEAAQGAGLSQAQAALDAAKLQLDNLTVTSSISGYVLNMNVFAGDVITGGKEIATVADVSSLKLTSTIPHDLVGKINQFEQVDVTIDGKAGERFTGTVTSISPVAVETGGHFPIEILISNSDRELSAGMGAKSRLSVLEKGIVIPRSALVSNSGEVFVYVIKDNVANKRVVTLGAENNDDVIIEYGLAEGEAVAVSNINAVFDKMEVEANDITEKKVYPKEEDDEDSSGGKESGKPSDNAGADLKAQPDEQFDEKDDAAKEAIPPVDSSSGDNSNLPSIYDLGKD